MIAFSLFKKLSFTIALLLTTTANAQDLIITTDVCATASEVRMTGTFWGWDPNAGPFAVDNGNGTWTFTLSPAPTADMEYLLVVDGIQENLVQDMLNGGECAPVSDYFSYAYRLWNVGDPDITGISFDRCVSCAVSDLVITTEICDATPNSVSLTGPIWNWDPNTGPDAIDNGDGTWSFHFAPAPSDSLEYLLVLDGTFEDLIPEMIDGGTCAPITDYSTHANRLWVNGEGDINNTFDQCHTCAQNSINETQFEALSIYPIPANQNIQISDETAIGNVKIYSLTWNKLVDTNISEQEGSITIDKLASGVYYLMITRNGESFVQKIVKM